MNTLLSIVAVASLTGASAVQHPLQDSSNSQALINSKPLISSDALQGHIKSDNLLKRAKELFQIAELGIDEYNHPTRVIGSEGKVPVSSSCTLALPLLIPNIAQDTLQPSITSTLQ
jgi:aminopeptidase Y